MTHFKSYKKLFTIVYIFLSFYKLEPSLFNCCKDSYVKDTSFQPETKTERSENNIEQLITLATTQNIAQQINAAASISNSTSQLPTVQTDTTTITIFDSNSKNIDSSKSSSMPLQKALENQTSKISPSQFIPIENITNSNESYAAEDSKNIDMRCQEIALQTNNNPNKAIKFQRRQFNSISPDNSITSDTEKNDFESSFKNDSLAPNIPNDHPIDQCFDESKKSMASHEQPKIGLIVVPTTRKYIDPAAYAAYYDRQTLHQVFNDSTDDTNNGDSTQDNNGETLNHSVNNSSEYNDNQKALFGQNFNDNDDAHNELYHATEFRSHNNLFPLFTDNDRFLSPSFNDPEYQGQLATRNRAPVYQKQPQQQRPPEQRQPLEHDSDNPFHRQDSN